MLSLFGRPGEARWGTFALRAAVLSLFGRPGEAHWGTFASGFGASAFGRPGGAHAVTLGVAKRPAARAACALGSSNSQCHGSLFTVRTKPNDVAWRLSHS
jgi:hypothetical protein